MALGSIVAARAGMPPPEPAVPDHAPFDAILARHVRSGSVDYLLLRKHDRETLARYLDDMARVDPSALSRKARLAFYFNLYNATMILAVIERFHAGYTPAENDWAVFDEPRVRLADGVVSLNALEHDLLRKRFDEPRLHVALVCAARSCPPLAARAYRGADLDETLEAAMRRFLSDGTRNRVDAGAGRLELSRIFDWYAADFGGRSRLGEYVSRFLGPEVREYAVEFLEYSWALNAAPPAAGRWVRITAERARLDDAATNARRDEVFEVLEEREGRLQIDLPLQGRTAWIAAGDAAPYP